MGFFAAADDLSAKLASGALSPERAAIAPKLIFNQQLDGWLTIFFVLVLWIVILDALRVCWRQLRGQSVPHGVEAPYLRTELERVGP